MAEQDASEFIQQLDERDRQLKNYLKLNQQYQAAASRPGPVPYYRISKLKRGLEAQGLRYQRSERRVAKRIGRVEGRLEERRMEKVSRERKVDIHLRQSGKTDSPIARKNARLYVWYMEKHRADAREIQNTIHAADFSVKHKLTRGEEYDRLDNPAAHRNHSLNQRKKRRDQAFETQGTFGTQNGTSPHTLGLSHIERERSTIKHRHRRLEGPALSTVDTWSAQGERDDLNHHVPNTRHMANGTGVQYWIPKKQPKTRTICHRVK